MVWFGNILGRGWFELRSRYTYYIFAYIDEQRTYNIYINSNTHLIYLLNKYLHELKLECFNFYYYFYQINYI